ncbi:MAG: flagellar hook-length control protein FliK [Clostridia bacterium]
MDILNIMSKNATNIQSVRQNDGGQLGFKRILSALMNGKLSDVNLSDSETSEIKEGEDLLKNMLEGAKDTINLDDIFSMDLAKLSEEDEQLDILVSQLITNLLEISNISMTNDKAVSKEMLKEGISNVDKSMANNSSNNGFYNAISENHKLTLLEHTDESKEAVTLKKVPGLVNTEVEKNDNKINEIATDDSDNDANEKLLIRISEDKTNNKSQIVTNDILINEKVKSLTDNLKDLLSGSKEKLKIIQKLNKHFEATAKDDKSSNEYLFNKQSYLINNNDIHESGIKFLDKLIDEFITKELNENSDSKNQVKSLETKDQLNKVELNDLKINLLEIVKKSIFSDKTNFNVNKVNNDEKHENLVDLNKVTVKQSEDVVLLKNKDNLSEVNKELTQNILAGKDERSTRDSKLQSIGVGKSIDKIIKNEEKVEKNTFQLVSNNRLEEINKKTEIKLESVEKNSAVKQVIEKIEYEKDGFSENIKIELKPKELGNLELEITRKNGKIEASIIVETDEAKTLIKNKSSQLIAAFERKNIQLSEFKTIVRKPNTNNANFNFSNNNGDGGQQYQHQQVNKYTNYMNNMQREDVDVMDENLQKPTKNYKYYGNSVNIFV